MKKNNILNKISDIWLFAIFLVLLNLVCIRAFVRIDMTSPRSYSLSSSSKEVVKTLELPMSIKVFFSKNLPAPYSSVEQYVKDILTEYKTAGNSNFSYEYFDMDKKENQKLAQNYGLQQIQIREVKNNEVGFKNVYMGIVLTYADTIEKLDGISTSDGLEYTMTNLMSKVIASTNALSGLSQNVIMTLYKSDALANFGINGFAQIDSAVQKAYAAMAKKFNGKIEFKTVSPTAEETDELNRKYGLQAVTWRNKDGSTGKGTIGLVLEMGEKFRVVPLELQNMIFSYGIVGLDSVEENISLSVEALVSKTSTVAYVTGHGEMDLNDEERGAANFNSILSDSYTLREINLAESDIPVGVQDVIVNGPKTAFTDEELYKLDQFLMKGGNLMLFLDSFETIEPDGQNMYYQQPQYLPVESGLEKLLSKYGVETGKNIVMDSSCYTQNHPQYGKLNFYYIPMMQKNSLNQKNPVSKNLGFVLFLQASSIDASKAMENKNVKVTSLAKSSDKSWTVSENFVLSPLGIYPPSDASTMKSETLAVLLEGKFDSAFDSAPSAGSDSADSDMKTSNHVSSSTQIGKIFIASTSQITGPQLIQKGSKEPVGMFVRNAVDYMNGNEDFCLMRTKNLSLNTLKIKSQAIANVVKYFNEIGLALIVAAAGLVAAVARKKRRNAIRMKYNPDDPRQSK